MNMGDEPGPLKLTFAIVGMFVLGAAGFCALAALVQVRIGRPVAAAPAAPDRSARHPLALLREGVRDAIQSAEDALRSKNQARTAAAMDAAKRAAEVGRDAESGDDFRRAFAAVENARLALQDGSRQEALVQLQEAAQALPPGTTRNQSLRNVDTSELYGYRGATVLNAQGVRVGEVERVSGRKFVVIVGGARDLLGCIDLPGGHQFEVPVEQTVMGKRKTLGSTMVVLPTLSASPERIESELVAAGH
jgi:hypothetical protein